MSHDETAIVKQTASNSLTGLQPNDKAIVEEMVDKVLSAEDGLSVVHKELTGLDPSGDLFPVLQTLLQSLGSYLLGLTYMSTGNFLDAREELKQSVEGFDQVGQSELRDVGIAFAMYAEAALEVRKGNVAKAQDTLKDVREYLRKAGKFGQMFQGLIDRMEPENLYLQAMQALNTRDFWNGKGLIEQAAQASEKVAKEYYDQDTSEYFAFMGMARFYKAMYEVHRSLSNFTELNYDALASEINLTRDAIQAKELLNKGSIDRPLIKVLAVTAEGSVEVLELISQLAPIMQMTLNSTFKPDPTVYEALRQRIRKANECFAQAGDQAALLLRFCDVLSNQVNNLERLAKPRPLEIQSAVLTVQENTAFDDHKVFRDAMLEGLVEPLKQLNRWSMLTLILVGLSVLLILVGAGSTMFFGTDVSVLTSVSSLFTTLISAVLFVQLNKARNDLKESRAEISQHFKAASDQVFKPQPVRPAPGGAAS